MEKERVWIFAIIIAFTIGICVMFRYQQMKTGTISQSHKETEQSTEETVEEADKCLSDESREYFKDAEHLTIEKVERTVVEDEAGNSTTNYDSYYVSDVDLVNQTDQTQDYVKALSAEEFDETLIETTEFENAFQVDYRDTDGWELYQSIIQKNGIDGNLENVSFDEDTYKLTGQQLYEMKQPGSILDSMLSEVSYDELLKQKVFYQSIEVENGIYIPDYFSAVVQYTKDKQMITKSLYIQVTVNNWEEE